MTELPTDIKAAILMLAIGTLIITLLGIYVHEDFLIMAAFAGIATLVCYRYATVMTNKLGQ